MSEHTQPDDEPITRHDAEPGADPMAPGSGLADDDNATEPAEPNEPA